MPRTRSQQRLEDEPEVIHSEPAVIGGVPPLIATVLTAVLLIFAAVLLSLLAGGDLQLGPEPEFTIGAPQPAPAAEPAPPPGDGTGTVLAGDTPILPLPPEGLAPYADRTIRGNAVPVLSVVADEGFWVGTSDRDRLYVIYQTGGLESPPDVDAGQLVSFVGSLEPTVGDLAPQFRLTEAEGLGYLQTQGHYISTADVDVLQDTPVEEPQ